MSDVTLTKTRIQAGRWEGVLKAPDGSVPPPVGVFHMGYPLPDVSVTPIEGRPGRWRVEVAIPAELLSEGVQTFVIQDNATGTRLSQFTVVTGVPLEDDIRAEVDLLRAELDMLKKAFRRHVLETGA